MKNCILLILFTYSISLSAQYTVTKDIYSFKTKEKNKKTITISKQTKKNNLDYILSVFNKSSPDYSKCKWVTTLSPKKLNDFITMLSEIKLGLTLQTDLFAIKQKNERVHVVFNDTKCTKEHKTHYFQKTCNRKLSFVINKNQINELNLAVNKEDDIKLLVKK
tara:strand:+ start:780 stop:1268 length:489 start_codon:yes stop_codon:yes gene_type:complete